MHACVCKELHVCPCICAHLQVLRDWPGTSGFAEVERSVQEQTAKHLGCPAAALSLAEGAVQAPAHRVSRRKYTHKKYTCNMHTIFAQKRVALANLWQCY